MNHLIQTGPLCGRRERRSPYRAGRKGRDGPRSTAAVAGYLTGRERKVLRQVHADELGGNVQHQRGVELPAMCRTGGILEKAREIECEDVDRENASAARAQGGQSLLVGVVPVSGENNERVDPALLPGAEQIIHPAVQRFPAHAGIAGIGAFGGGIHTIGDRRRPQHAER